MRKCKHHFVLNKNELENEIKSVLETNADKIFYSPYVPFYGSGDLLDYKSLVDKYDAMLTWMLEREDISCTEIDYGKIHVFLTLDELEYYNFVEYNNTNISIRFGNTYFCSHLVQGSITHIQDNPNLICWIYAPMPLSRYWDYYVNNIAKIGGAR